MSSGSERRRRSGSPVRVPRGASPTRHPARRWAGAAASAILLVGIAVGCVAPPDEPAVDASVLDQPPEVDPRTYTVRIRSQTCEGLGVGSGFLIDDRTIITNRHVVEGADELEVETSEGEDLRVAVASQGLLADLAVVALAEPLDMSSSVDATARLASENPDPGDALRAFGYPGGGALTVTEGVVEDYTVDPRLGNLSKVIRSDVEIEPGSSGGPAVNDDDEVIGVVYAIEVDTSKSLIVPVETLQRLLEDPDGLEHVEGC